MSVRALGIRVALITLVSGAVLSVSGCGVKFLPFEPADFPMAIREDGSTISAVVCKSVVADHVLVQVRVTPENKWNTTFEARREAVFASGGRLFAESQSQGMNVVGPKDVKVAEHAQVIVMIDSPRSSFTSLFTTDHDLSGDIWLHPDGSETTKPCPSPKDR